MEMNQQLIENKGDNLFTTIYPNKNKETVILLHGGPGVPDELKEIVEMLTHKYQVITFHQRGTRKSPCKSNDYSMEAYSSDIEAIASYFKLKNFHLFGHSWGGLYAQIYAQLHPEQILSLFLCCPGSGTGKQWKVTEREILKFNRSKTTLAEWMGMGFNSLLGMLGSDNAHRRLFRQVIKNYNKGYATSANEIDFQNVEATPINQTRKEIRKYPMLEICQNPNFKITIVYGDGDIYNGSKNFVINRYPTAKVQMIENCGHFPWQHNLVRFKSVMAEHYGL